jgi:EAL domain-containing protein (putative c-di-GMP-specific phosphodiesterase class I)
MYRAKERGRGRFELFDEDLRHRALTRLRLESDLRRALDHEELVLHYQPVVDMRTGATVAFEALVRWRHPERGMVGPAEFIGVAEASGLIVPMTEWVLHHGLLQLARWRGGALHEGLALGVNVSARDVVRRDFVDSVVAALAAASVPPDRLSLEITESVLMESGDAPADALRALTELGVMITLDDFGTGYSSLSYLERFPVDVLKIDRSFVAPLAAGAGDGPVVRAILGLAGGLGLQVVAEGVETRAQEERLLELGCLYAQGFRYAPPLDAAACAGPLADRLRPSGV